MNSRCIMLLFLFPLFALFACSNEGDEEAVARLITVANSDVIDIHFADTNETILSTGDSTYLIIEGTRSNGVDTTTVTEGLQWQLSPSSSSSIDQAGHFTAGTIAETVTITAKLGFLTATYQLSVSTAKFDRVASLDKVPGVNVDMCRQALLQPQGLYIDENGGEEIRNVDSTTLATIDWQTLDENNAFSDLALVEYIDAGARLITFASGVANIQATTFSVYDNAVKSSDKFPITVNNNLQELKLCRANTSDLSTCSLTNPLELNKGETYTIIAVGRYQGVSGETLFENISRAVKWGLDTSTDLDVMLTSTENNEVLDALKMTTNTTGSSTNITVACGTIIESVSLSDLSNGIILDTPVSCSQSDASCLSTSLEITSSDVTADSLEVKYLDILLTDNEIRYLSSHPAQIQLTVTLDYSDGSSEDITNNAATNYTIVQTTLLPVIEETSTPGLFLVVSSGVAQINITHGGTSFIALLNVP